MFLNIFNSLIFPVCELVAQRINDCQDEIFIRDFLVAVLKDADSDMTALLSRAHRIYERNDL